MRAAWSGQPRNSVARSRSRSSSVRPGSGVASVSSVAPAISVESSPAAKPSGPEERHRNVEPLAGADAASVETGRGGSQRTAVGVDHAFGRPRLPEVKRMTMSSDGPDHLLQRVDEGGVRRTAG